MCKYICRTEYGALAVGDLAATRLEGITSRRPLSVSWDFEAVTPSRSGEMRAETYNPPSSLMMLACIFQPKPGLRVKA